VKKKFKRVNEMPFGEYKDFEDCVSKNQDKDDAEAYCAEIKRKIEGDNYRYIGFDAAVLDSQIIVDDDDVLTVPAIIASEIVHEYEDGWAYKPADELEKMVEVASSIGSVPVKILGHPSSATYSLLVKPQDVDGRATNFRFVKISIK